VGTWVGTGEVEETRNNARAHKLIYPAEGISSYTTPVICLMTPWFDRKRKTDNRNRQNRTKEINAKSDIISSFSNSGFLELIDHCV
jgi:hypothetical protein